MTTQNQTIKKILIAPDKFKGSLTSTQAALAIRRGIEERGLLPCSSSLPASAENASGQICAPEFRIIEIADGGDGSLEVLQKKIPGAEVVPIAVHNPVGKEVISQILLYRSARAGNSIKSCPETENVVFCAQNSAEFCSEGDSEGEKCGKQCAFIEMAKVSGLEMLAKEERNPLHTSTYGMGEAIRAAIARGAKEITLSIGGSATNDGGTGMLQALGYKFYDTSGDEIPAPICGGDLCRVATIEAPQRVVEGCVKFKVICDVTNPLLGTQGATTVYGPQKGADEKALQLLEAGLANYAAVAEKCLNIPQNRKEYPGAGAAGGVGYAGLAFLKAELLPGWKFFAQITSLEQSVQWADLVITGEGSLDSQSLSGKVVSGVLNLAAIHHKPTIIFCGINKLAPDEMKALSCTLPDGINCYSIASLGLPLEVCMRDAAQLLQQLAKVSI